MKLRDLLKYNDIVIQCHDNPDADALASGYGLWWYLKKNGKRPRFIYRGKNKIQKSNLVLMLSFLEIPVKYEPDFSDNPELLVTVDCQYGQRNVTKTEAQEVAIIDHHQKTVELPPLSEVKSNIGSCSTIIWDMIRQEGLDVVSDVNLSTALYYGLYTDTNRFSEISHPLDRDMIDSLIVNKSIITEMSNSNISLDELKITGRAIQHYHYMEQNKYIVLHAEKCDPNILGVISDFSMETAGINVCLAYYTSPEEVKFSVRSCVKEVHANELAAFIAEGIGGGGGHLFKAGGTLRPEKLPETKEEKEFDAMVYSLFIDRLNQYFDMYEIIYAKEMVLDTTDMEKYEKKPMELGYVKMTDIFPVDSLAEIRTLEGDINIRVKEDTYLMIGIAGEVYPITKQKLKSSYELTGSKYSRSFEYDPSIKNIVTGEKISVLNYANGVISTGKSRILAKKLDHHVKLFTAWDDEKYYSGTPGDYIAVREDDEHDIYIISGELFDDLYEKV